jgi:hypothetical protein
MIFNKKHTIVLLSLFIPLLLASCAPLPKEEDNIQVPAGTIIFEDDFEAYGTWDEGWEETFGAGYDRLEQYRLYVRENTEVNPAVPNDPFNQNLQDTIVQAHIAAIQGFGWGGLFCRAQDPDNFYFGAFHNRGDYGIFLFQNGELSPLVTGADDIINTASGTNRVAFTCAGNTLALTINDQAMAEVQDATFTSGVVGIAVQSDFELGVDAIFDNFFVIDPN